jgi:RNA polymerase sigma-70 factor, ECF subfamily
MVERTREGATTGLVRCFDSIYDANHRALHAYFLGRTSDPEAALDLSQEAFLRVWRNIFKLQELTPQRQRYWLYAVAKNLVADLYRGCASQKAARQSVATDLRSGGNHEEGPQAALESRERLEAVDRAMNELPEDLRTALVMQVCPSTTAEVTTEIMDVLRSKAETRNRSALAIEPRVVAVDQADDHGRDGNKDVEPRYAPCACFSGGPIRDAGIVA